MVVMTMIFNVGIIPNYMLIRRLGLLNTLFALIVPLCFNGFNMFIVRNYMQTIPESVFESATIDGANHPQILVKIVIPFSVPVIATISLFFAVTYWNDYIHAMLYITTYNLKPLQL
jgi:putative aldouronate transport system permease protein